MQNFNLKSDVDYIQVGTLAVQTYPTIQMSNNSGVVSKLFISNLFGKAIGNKEIYFKNLLPMLSEWDCGITKRDFKEPELLPIQKRERKTAGILCRSCCM